MICLLGLQPVSEKGLSWGKGLLFMRLRNLVQSCVVRPEIIRTLGLLLGLELWLEL